MSKNAGRNDVYEKVAIKNHPDKGRDPEKGVRVRACVTQFDCEKESGFQVIGVNLLMRDGQDIVVWTTEIVEYIANDITEKRQPWCVRERFTLAWKEQRLRFSSIGRDA
ncbi:hypothetical protein AKJ16_DCAP00696 [Drosera capensis]